MYIIYTYTHPPFEPLSPIPPHTSRSSQNTRLGFLCYIAVSHQVFALHWKRKWQPSTVFLPGEFHGQRSPAGYSPRGCKESDMTE